MSDSLYTDAMYSDSRYRHIPYPRLAKWLRIAVALMTILGTVLYFIMIPAEGGAMALSHLVGRAAELQEDSDLTI